MIIMTNGECRDMLLPFSLTLVAGAFFALLFLYWLLVFVKKFSPSNSLVTVPWFFLAMFYAAAVSALAIGIYEQSDMIVHYKLPKKDDIECSNSMEIRTAPVPCCSKVLWDYKSVLRLPLFALGSLGVLCAVYVCVFLVCACRKKAGHQINNI